MASVLLELRRGVSMKIIGLAAKASFVLFFAQKLNAGEFSRYFIGFSTALVFARIIGMGGDDELSYRVGGRRTTSGRYFSVAVCFSSIGTILAILSLIISNYTFHVLAAGVAFFLAGSAFATGALRSVSNFFQEFRANALWIIVCVLVFLLPFRKAEHILYAICFSYVLIHLIEYPRIKKAGISPSLYIRPVLRYHFKRITSWLPKSISTAALAGSLRAFPLWIGFLKLGATDKLAYAFAIGEVAYQFSMTYVNLLHSSKKYRASASKMFWRVALVFLLLATGISIVLYGVLKYLVQDKIGIGLNLLLFSSYYAASIALFSFARVGAWDGKSSKSVSGMLLFVQALMFCVPGLFVSILGFQAIQIFIAAVINTFAVAFVHRYLSLKGI